MTQIFEKLDEQLLLFIFHFVMCLYDRQIKQLVDSQLKSSEKFSDLTNYFLNTIVFNIQRVLKRCHIRIRIRFGEYFYLDMVSLQIFKMSVENLKRKQKI